MTRRKIWGRGGDADTGLEGERAVRNTLEAKNKLRRDEQRAKAKNRWKVRLFISDTAWHGWDQRSQDRVWLEKRCRAEAKIKQEGKTFRTISMMNMKMVDRLIV